MKHCHWKFKAHLAVPNLLRGQLVPGVTLMKQRNLDLFKKVKPTKLHFQPKKKNPEGCLI